MSEGLLKIRTSERTAKNVAISLCGRSLNQTKMGEKVLKSKTKMTEVDQLKAELAQVVADLALERARIEAFTTKRDQIFVIPSKTSTIKFGVTSDRHVGSLYHNGEALNAFYDYAKEQGVKMIFDAGDMLDGHKIYRGQEFELRDLGLERQLDRITKDSPRGIETHFITGNHDDSFKHAAGADVGRAIAAAIPGYHFIGSTKARYIWKTPNGDCIFDLLHPGGGTAYALSYKVQKIIDSLEGGTKPDVLAIGHFHKAELLPSYRNVCGLQAGTFQMQTPFMARLGTPAHVGGWIVEIKIGPKKLYKTVRGEFVAFYHRADGKKSEKKLVSFSKTTGGKR